MAHGHAHWREIAVIHKRLYCGFNLHYSMWGLEALLLRLFLSLSISLFLGAVDACVRPGVVFSPSLFLMRVQ